MEIVCHCYNGHFIILQGVTDWCRFDVKFRSSLWFDWEKWSGEDDITSLIITVTTLILKVITITVEMISKYNIYQCKLWWILCLIPAINWFLNSKNTVKGGFAEFCINPFANCCFRRELHVSSHLSILHVEQEVSVYIRNYLT